jgi:hypothetical protein
MKVNKEEVVKDITIKNLTVKHLLQYYAKLANTDFESKDFDLALQVMEDSIKVEDAFKAYVKLETAMMDRAKKGQDENGNISVEIIEKFNNDIKELSNKTTTIVDGLTKIPEHIFKKLPAKPIELKVLKEVGVI